MTLKKMVFVHGSDHKQDLTPWMFYHLHPSHYGATALKSDGENFDLVYFDYADGTRKEWNNWSATRAESLPSSPPDLTGQLLPKVKIRDDNGVETGAEHPSVLAFYRWVKNQPEHSIASIQIFSHGVIFQPVLFAAS